jgi:adenylate cyclase
MRTLHPQWAGYTYTWRRDLNAIQPVQFERGDEYEQEVLNSPFTYLTRQAEISAQGGDPWRNLRRRLAGPEAQLDFPVLEGLAAGGATDYFAEVVRFGANGDPSRGSGIGYSFATDRPAGFSDDDLEFQGEYFLTCDCDSEIPICNNSLPPWVMAVLESSHSII